MTAVLNGMFDRSTAALTAPMNFAQPFSDKPLDPVDTSGLMTFFLILTLIALAAAAIFLAAVRFKRIAREEAADLFSKTANETSLTPQMLAALPQVVQRWMYRADVVGKAVPNKLIVHQRGTLRTKPDGKWMPFQAVQYFTIDPPGFVWVATIKAAPMMNIAGRDTFRDGHGSMLIKPLYIFKASEATGKEIDQGSLVRYLAEMAWFPQAAANSHLRWQSVNESQAQVTMEYGGISASGTYSFNADGDVVAFEAKRYGDFGGIYRKEQWSVKTTSFADINGIRLGNKSEVTWKLPEGDFYWLNMEVVDIAPGAFKFPQRG